MTPPLPANPEAEMGLLGAILLDNRAYEQVAMLLRPEHFGDTLNGEIYAAMAALLDDGKPATGPMLAQAFDAERRQEIAAYSARLVRDAISVVNAGHYGRVIRQLAHLRAAVAQAQDMLAAAAHYDPNRPLAEIIGPLAQTLDDAADMDTSLRPAVPLGEAAADALRRAYEARSRGGGISGLSTGLPGLDAVLGGLRPGELVVVAGTTGMGKSALGVTLSINVAESARGAMMFSLEMSETDIAWRALARDSGVSGARQMSGRFGHLDDEALEAAAAHARDLAVIVDANPMSSVSHIRRRVRAARRRQRVDLIIVDYIQLLLAERRSDSRAAEVAAVTRGLKVLAKELDVPIVALSQLSRQVEARDDKRPRLADLRESGAIEQDADAVIFVFREEYYERRNKPRRRSAEGDAAYYDRLSAWEADYRAIRSEADLIVAKNRHGPCDEIKCQFDLDRGLFHEAVPSASNAREGAML